MPDYILIQSKRLLGDIIEIDEIVGPDEHGQFLTTAASLLRLCHLDSSSA